MVADTNPKITSCVAHILPLDAYAELAAFFGGFMKQDD